MNISQIMAKLEGLGSESYKRIILRHDIRKPVFGVKVDELKKIHKLVKTDYQLALELFATKNYDAQYLAGLITDDAKMTTANLNAWLATANGLAICKTTLAWVAASGVHGWPVALRWIDGKTDRAAAAGWSTLGSYVGITPDHSLDIPTLKELLMRVEKTIHNAPNDVRGSMNGFVIAVGTYVTPLTELAIKTGKAIGPVTIDVGETSCKVPYAPDYIAKAQKRGTIGKKRKMAKC